MKNKIIKLVHDKYENEVGVLYDAETNELEKDLTKILEQLPTKIGRCYFNLLIGRSHYLIRKIDELLTFSLKHSLNSL